METADHSGHRSRLREQFLNSKEAVHTDEELLELLLTYAIPQKDVRPLTSALVTQLGGLDGVLSASSDTLMAFDGIKLATATLIKCADWVRKYHSAGQAPTAPLVAEQSASTPAVSTQVPLFEVAPSVSEISSAKPSPAKTGRTVISKARTGLFGKAVLKEAIELLPRLPETESLDELRVFLGGALRYNAFETRKRFGNYIIRRMFPLGYADLALRRFAADHAGRQELRDVCFYRFCQAEPLMLDVLHELLLPAVSRGRIQRSLLANYLAQIVPGAAKNTIQSCSHAIIDALVAGDIAKVDREQISFAYRDILPDSFAFVLHSEFPEPSIYTIEALERNQAVQTMLWNPARILPMLYELRNRGLISKVSEIDSVRQFSTRWNLEQVVTALRTEKGSA